MNLIPNSAHYICDIMSGIAELPKHAGTVIKDSSITITGIIGSALSILSLGNVQQFNECANCTLYAARILPDAYQGIIRILDRSELKQPQRLDKVMGFFRKELTLSTFLSLHRMYIDLNTPKSTTGHWLKAHVTIRWTFAVATVAAVVARIADLILGSIAAPLSILFLGECKRINSFAYKNLSVFGVIDDLCIGIRAIVNPTQFTAVVF